MSGENGTPANDGAMDDAFEAPDVVTLEDEEGNTMDFALLAIVEVEEQDYALLTPVEQLEDEAGESMDLFLFQYDEEGDGTASFSEIDDEDTYNKVRDVCSALVDNDDIEVETVDA